MSVLRLLLCTAGVDSPACAGRALVSASLHGQVGAVSLLLGHGVSARAENSGALRAAAGAGKLEAVRLLLQHGADSRAAGGAAIREAAEGGYGAVVAALAEAGVKAGGRRATRGQAVLEAQDGEGGCSDRQEGRA